MQQVLINITLDYETWQPIPPGYVIDWQEDIFRPTELWMGCAEKYDIRLTFFVEMAELFWLRTYQPTIAHIMEAQITSMIARKHDVQLHLHPAWLPELGTTYNNGQWYGLNSNQRLHDIPLDLDQLIQRCKDELEILAEKANPNFSVTTFRAAKYQIQPSAPITSALLKAGIIADSSVWKEGKNSEHGFDFTQAHHFHQPYFAYKNKVTHLDNNNKDFLEIPIFSANGQEWSFDNHTKEDILEPFLLACNDYGLKTSFSLYKNLSATLRRHRRQTAAFLTRIAKGKAYYTTQKIKRIHNYPQEPFIFTAIGHTKNQKNAELLHEVFSQLSTLSYIQSVTTSDIVKLYFKKDPA